MQLIKLKLEQRFGVVVEIVSSYGYFEGEPKCHNDECTSELMHLIDDWQTGEADLKWYQRWLGMNDYDFEQLLGSIYVADVIEYEGSNTNAKRPIKTR
ncbi:MULTISPECIES: hypothetical protein [Latilactobacillus]|uniref:hypothetical protein n=1 Tax=Latilactobacillus TaxID=2767885 RepID=UPI000976D5A3|nr:MULTISPECIES: hypothetical protein [Latilactobacillus]WEU69660.1 hypothetical protein [Latilactobacillus phage TMW 1.1381 P1]AWV73285.1 hypothetical protein C0W45_06890 [Latilactobacillus curvatus]MCT3525913.1 hypothetical protein [Latilactobacillus curvatus]UTB70121.1 hypothetical protein A4W71_02995 [Latilactobacillus curvatus]UTB74633.1 hypothetical protein A4W73_07105 [Latilactobacillus curvatus]